METYEQDEYIMLAWAYTYGPLSMFLSYCRCAVFDIPPSEFRNSLKNLLHSLSYTMSLIL